MHKGLRWLRDRVGSISAMFVELSCGKGAQRENWAHGGLRWLRDRVGSIREFQASKTTRRSEGSNVFQAASLMFVELIGFQASAAERLQKLERAEACAQVEASLFFGCSCRRNYVGPKEKQRRSRQRPSYDVIWSNMMGLNLEPIWNILQFIFFKKGPGTKSNWMQNPDQTGSNSRKKRTRKKLKLDQLFKQIRKEFKLDLIRKTKSRKQFKLDPGLNLPG